MRRNYRLENSKISVEFDPEHGRIVSPLNKETGLEIISERRLAENFRLLVPLPDLHHNYVVGGEQPLSDFRMCANSATLLWQDIRAESGPLDMSVEMTVLLGGLEATFELKVDNRTPYPLEEVWTPVLAGIQGIRDRTSKAARL